MWNFYIWLWTEVPAAAAIITGLPTIFIVSMLVARRDRHRPGILPGPVDKPRPQPRRLKVQSPLVWTGPESPFEANKFPGDRWSSGNWKKNDQIWY